MQRGKKKKVILCNAHTLLFVKDVDSLLLPSHRFEKSTRAPISLSFSRTQTFCIFVQSSCLVLAIVAGVDLAQSSIDSDGGFLGPPM